MVRIAGLAAVVGFITLVARADVTGVALGPDAPPDTLGGYTLLAFPPDPSPVFSDLSSLDGPTGTLTFDPAVSHRRTGQGWATWSHGYLGDIYYPNGSAEVTLDLPPDTGAFIVYAEPGPFAEYTMRATTDDGTVVSQQVHGDSGAAGFGFYATGGDTIGAVTVEIVTAGVNMAVGEFSIAEVPEPAMLPLLALSGLLIARRRN